MVKRWLSRPDPGSWAPDELMALNEVAAIFFPDGPLTLTSLRTAVRRGELHVTRINGKLYTTPAAVAAMTSCAPAPVGPPTRMPSRPAVASAPVARTDRSIDAAGVIRHLLRPISRSV